MFIISTISEFLRLVRLHRSKNNTVTRKQIEQASIANSVTLGPDPSVVLDKTSDTVQPSAYFHLRPFEGYSRNTRGSSFQIQSKSTITFTLMLGFQCYTRVGNEGRVCR